MNVVCVGGGPGGLLLGILLRLTNPGNRVTVLERNGPDDTFGFGVVFSDETLATLSEADPEVFTRIEAEFIHWPEIEIHHRGRVLVSGGHGFAALARVRLLQLLGQRAAEVGVDVRYRTEVGSADLDRLSAEHDLVVGCDGVNSLVRRSRAEVFEPVVEPGLSKFVWLGTPKVFPRFTFVIEETEHGVVQAHCYPYSRDMSTFIVETRPRPGGRSASKPPRRGTPVPARTTSRPSPSPSGCSAHVLDGRPIVGNNSKWLEFPTVANEPVARRQRGASWATPPTPPTSRSARGPSWPWRTPSGWPAPWPPTRPTLSDALDAYEADRRAGGGQPAAGGPRQPRVVRGDPALRRPRARDVRVPAPHPQPAHHLRQPAAPGRGVQPPHPRPASGRTPRSTCGRPIRRRRRCSTRSRSAG